MNQDSKDIKDIQGYRDNMVCPIALTTVFQLNDGGSLQYSPICIDAIFVKKIEHDRLGTTIYMDDKKIEVIEAPPHILIKIGQAFLKSDKRKIAETVLKYGIGL